VKDIVENDQYHARDMLRKIQLKDGSSLMVPGVVPKLSATPGDFEGGGPELGEHTLSVLQSMGLQQSQLDGLRAKGVI
jgi:formyl-CoA transferase